MSTSRREFLRGVAIFFSGGLITKTAVDYQTERREKEIAETIKNDFKEKTYNKLARATTELITRLDQTGKISVEKNSLSDRIAMMYLDLILEISNHLKINLSEYFQNNTFTKDQLIRFQMKIVFPRLEKPEIYPPQIPDTPINKPRFTEGPLLV